MRTLAKAVDGKKTYAVAIGFVLYAIGSALIEEMTWNEAIEWFLAAGGLAAIRDAIRKLIGSVRGTGLEIRRARADTRRR